MTTLSTTQTRPLPHARLPLSLRLALRELRGGLSGFYVFVACIALGVAAIAAIGTLSAALQSGIAREGQALLGGDVEARRVHRQADDAERRVLFGLGNASEVATLRAMVRSEGGDRQALIDLKAVDSAYPLYGALRLESGAGLDDTVRRGMNAVVDRSLLDQLSLKLGDRVRLGTATVTLTGVIAAEPDRLSGGPAFGPRMLISLGTFARTGLNQPGSLINWRYRIRLDDGSAPAVRGRKGFEALLGEALPRSGFAVRDRNNPSPGVSRAIRRLTEFLTLVGLAALLAGGIGVANAVTAFIERKRRVIAAYKALGAPRRLITRSFLLQVLMLAGLGVAVGLIMGVLIPHGVTGLYGHLLPVRLGPSLYPQALALAAAYGLLTALVFILWPLGHAAQVRAGELLREAVTGFTSLPPWSFVVASGVSAALLAGAAIGLSAERWIAFLTVLALAATFLMFWALGLAFRRLARAMPRARRPEIALALANIAGPGSLTRTVTLSLGAGLTLLTAIALTNASLTAELQTQLPERAPSHFFLGIAKGDYDAFAGLIAAKAPAAELRRAPMLRGRITALAGTPVERFEAPQHARWVLNGDRGLTFAERLPEDSTIVEGEWWPPDHRGEPLVSFEVELAHALGLRIGDRLTVNVLGREVTARIANLRTVQWESLAINFVMIFSSNTLEHAPYNILATLTWPGAHDDAAEVEVVRAVANRFPAVTAIRVRDALDAVAAILGNIFLAIRAAGGLTLLAGVIVLAGALATAQRRRIYEAVVLKTLGATRRRILAAHVTEMLLLGVATAVAAAAAGAALAFGIVTEIMDVPFRPSLFALLQAALLATIFMLAFGLFGTARVLRAKAAPYLRRE